MSVLRTYQPPYDQVVGKTVTGLRRIGKRIVWEFGEDQLYLVIHLMVAGRLRWHDREGVKPPGRVGLAAWGFPGSTLVLTEQGSKRRAGIWVIAGEDNLAAEDRGGLEPLDISAARFGDAIRARNHTLKRALTSQSILSGIGNAYSDEILWEARLSPVRLTSRLSDDEVQRLHRAVVKVLTLWIERLAAETGEKWPTRVTAFRPEMAVHGKYGESCPRCGAPVQRIVYASNETNYCARARRAESSWPIAHCRDYSKRTGRRHLRSWRSGEAVPAVRAAGRPVASLVRISEVSVVRAIRLAGVTKSYGKPGSDRPRSGGETRGVLRIPGSQRRR